MAPEESQPTIAIAFVVDSSFSIFTNWNNILHRYVSPLIKRVTESYPSTPYSLAFVTYGPSDAVPSPILCKKFFQESSTVAKHMREEPMKAFALGSTNTGGSKGMATLEGLVAAVEMFDTLLKFQDSSKHRPPVCHLIHISASVPDDSVHPHWNDLPELDETTWEKLSSDLSSRDINFNSIVLNSKKTSCSELHSSISAAKVVAPWFPVEQSHSVLLSGFNTALALKGTKRPGDSSVPEKAPDAKKLRPAPSPKPAAASPAIKPGTPPSQSQPSQSQPPPAMPPFFPNTNVPLSKLPPQFQTACMQLHVYEDQLKRLTTMLRETMSSSQSGQDQSERASQIRAEIMKKAQPYQKLKQSVMQFAARLNANQQQQTQNIGGSMQQPPGGNLTPVTQAAGLNQSSPAGVKMGVSPKPDPAQRPPSLPSASIDVNVSTNTQIPPDSQTLQGRTPSNLSQPGSSQNISANNLSVSVTPAIPQTVMPGLGAQPKAQMPPDVAAQMHKLIEQSERNGRPFGVPGPGGSMPNANPSQTQATTNQNVTQSQVSDLSGVTSPSPAVAGANTNPMAGGTRLPGHTQQNPAANSTPKGPPVWQGVFFLPAEPQYARREFKVQVAMYANATHLSAAHSDTWPPTMQLNMTRDHVVPNMDLQMWIRRTQAVVCLVQPANRENDANLTNFNVLLELLSSSQCYAAAGWTTPNGTQTNNAIFFPMNGVLAAAICPVNGISEMPKPVFASKYASLTDTQKQSLAAYMAARSGNGNNPALMNANNRPGPSGMMPGQRQVPGIMPGGVRPGNPPHHAGSQTQQPSHPLLGNTGAMNTLMGKMGTNGAPMRPNMGAGMAFPGQMNNPPRPGGATPGVGIGGVSLEMMQSFMQRNGELGNNGMGQGGMG
ncbi:hypothetical protein K435DRAFT_962742 [Dendrothele bispora CBS 962.96]|uniref:Mediator of RNA polymerase II transcription subunit 25 n=1 Tax=Dendrothele bispora (strain CBS 962.96) TaxID=1314807 RepID=A0A4S8MJ17_DENBC|nr:hypothetical protein K435DRAFT_962742 [Dendrothele bispora CBS 962.96]